MHTDSNPMTDFEPSETPNEIANRRIRELESEITDLRAKYERAMVALEEATKRGRRWLERAQDGGL